MAPIACRQPSVAVIEPLSAAPMQSSESVCASSISSIATRSEGIRL